MSATLIIDNINPVSRIVLYLPLDVRTYTDHSWTEKQFLNPDMQYISWSEVPVSTYQLLIKKATEKYLKLSTRDQKDPTHPSVNTLTFLACAYVRKMIELTSNFVDCIKVQRFSENEYVFNTTLSFSTTKSASKTKEVEDVNLKLLNDLGADGGYIN